LARCFSGQCLEQTASGWLLSKFLASDGSLRFLVPKDENLLKREEETHCGRDCALSADLKN
jgi:hypothetical protein